jgi:hypothetical protein
MSHIEYFNQETSSSLDASVARLEQAISIFLQLVYGEEPLEFNTQAPISDRIGAVADVIEGLA